MQGNDHKQPRVREDDDNRDQQQAASSEAVEETPRHRQGADAEEADQGNEARDGREEMQASETDASGSAPGDAPRNWEERLNDDWGFAAAPSAGKDGGGETPDSAEHGGKEERPMPAGELKWKKPVPAAAPDPVSPAEAMPAPPQPPAATDADSGQEEASRPWFTRRRMLMITFVWFPLLAIAALAGGLLIGYSVIGDDPAGDVFTKDLWEHLYKLIYG